MASVGADTGHVAGFVVDADRGVLAAHSALVLVRRGPNARGSVRVWGSGVIDIGISPVGVEVGVVSVAVEVGVEMEGEFVGLHIDCWSSADDAVIVPSKTESVTT